LPITCPGKAGLDAFNFVLQFGCASPDTKPHARHQHDYHELLYVVKGRMVNQEGTLELEKGEYKTFPSKVPHEAHVTEESVYAILKWKSPRSLQRAGHIHDGGRIQPEPGAEMVAVILISGECQSRKGLQMLKGPAVAIYKAQKADLTCQQNTTALVVQFS
jgi:mannose-6-phosphate isomerase-like protein (cupin superfamily)